MLHRVSAVERLLNLAPPRRPRFTLRPGVRRPARMMAKLEEGLTHCNPEAAVSVPVLKSRLLALRAAPAQQMSHYWLTYGSADGLVGVVIMEAPSMLQARMNAAVRSIAAGAPFAEGHELSAR